jgi:hypothetical protein
VKFAQKLTFQYLVANSHYEHLMIITLLNQPSCVWTCRVVVD